MRTTVVIVLGLGLVAGCAAAPVPTPSPRIVEVEVPGPTQTIEVEVPGPTIEVVPQVCLDALDGANTMILEHLEILLGVMSDYVDYPDETLEEFGLRIENRIVADEFLLDDGDAYFEDSEACLDAALETGGPSV